MFRSLLAVLLLFLLQIIVNAQDREPRISFVDVTAQTEIDFVHTDGSCGENYLYQLMGAGLVTLDYDNDKWIDICFVSGVFDRVQPAGQVTSSTGLYRNNHDGTFASVSAQANLMSRSYGLGATAADYDNDGFLDLYFSNFGENILFHNQGDGTFVDVTSHSKVADKEKFSAGVGFLDYDGDGDLDLFAATYVDFSAERHLEIARRSFPFPPGPGDYQGLPDTFFRNDGDGVFTDVSKQLAFSGSPGPSMGVLCGDINLDGYSDIVVCNDAAPNRFYLNDRQGGFSESALVSGIAYDLSGNANGSMGLDAADFDGDMLVDVFITNYTGQMPVLYRGYDRGLFEDSTRAAQVGRQLYTHTNWGAGFADFENDGDLDLYISNGHFLKNIKSFDDRTDYEVPNTLFVNNGGQFQTAASMEKAELARKRSSRGIALDDLDNDGDTDIVVLNANDLPTILSNQYTSVGTGNWLDMILVGRSANRDAVGANVVVTSAGLTQLRQVVNGRGYQSHFGSKLHFGLGDQESVDSVVVHWPGGKREGFTIENINTVAIIVEGDGAGTP